MTSFSKGAVRFIMCCALCPGIADWRNCGKVRGGVGLLAIFSVVYTLLCRLFCGAFGGASQ